MKKETSKDSSLSKQKSHDDIKTLYITPSKNCHKKSPTKKKPKCQQIGNNLNKTILTKKTDPSKPFKKPQDHRSTLMHLNHLNKRYSSQSSSFSKSKGTDIYKKKPQKLKKNEQWNPITIEGEKQGVSYKFKVQLLKQNAKQLLGSPYTSQLRIKELESKAKKLMKEGKLEQAKKILQEVLFQKPKSIKALYYIGKIYKTTNKQKTAFQSFKKCLEVIKNDLQTLYYKGCCLMEMEQYVNALTVFNKGLLLNGAYKERILQMKGNCLKELGNFEDALQSYKQALDLGSKDYNLHVKIADIYNHYTMYQNAVKHYDQYLSHVEFDDDIIKKRNQCNDKVKVKNKQLQKGYQTLGRVASRTIINQTAIKLCLQDKDYQGAYKNYSKFKNYLKDEPDLQQSEYHQFIKGLFLNGLLIQAKDVILSCEEKFNSYKILETKAKINLQLGLLQQCQDNIKDTIRLMETRNVTFLNLLGSTNEAQIFQNLKNLMNRLQQMNAFTLTQSNTIQIMNRRKVCLNQAIRLFEPDKSEVMSRIMEQSSYTMQESKLQKFDIENNVFQLRNIRKVFQNWNEHEFSLQSMDRTVQIAFDMVKSDKDDFSILPIHIVSFMMKNYQLGFQKINEKLQEKLNNLCKKYPPNCCYISESKLQKFSIPTVKKEKIDLFGKNVVFKNYQEIYKAIQNLAQKAQQQIYVLDSITQQICKQTGGTQYKSGLKLPINQKGFEQRIMCRIIQKMLSKDLKTIKNEYLSSITLMENCSLGENLNKMHEKWQQIIEKIITKKREGLINTPCYVYDFLRAKCMFDDLQSLEKAVKLFCQKQQLGEVTIMEIENRIQYKTKDVALKVKFKELVGQIQFALKFESIKNEFNHSLYELHRSPFGACFASIMWLSGYALKDKQLLIKQKLKWKLNGLQHLRKFIYCQKLFVDFGNLQSIVQKKLGKLYLVDFHIEYNRIQGYLVDQQGKYLMIDKKMKGNLRMNSEKPEQKLQINFWSNNLIFDGQYKATIKLLGTQKYLFIDQAHKIPRFTWQQADLKKSVPISNFTLKFSQCCEIDYQKHIYNAIQKQKQVTNMMKF